jgi:hypothetical protein
MADIREAGFRGVPTGVEGYPVFTGNGWLSVQSVARSVSEAAAPSVLATTSDQHNAFKPYGLA